MILVYHSLSRVCAGFVVVLAAGLLVAQADAIMVTKAMTAPTMAEIYIEADQVRTEFEIGFDEIRAYRNMLSDEIYERLGYDPEPLTNRLARFSNEERL